MTQIGWTDVVTNVAAKDAADFLDVLKKFTVAKSNAVPCIVCTDPHPHTMRYRILKCSATSCRHASETRCPWRGRHLECSKNGETTIQEYEDHVSEDAETRKQTFSTDQKEHIQNLAELRVKPSRIRNSLASKFKLVPDAKLLSRGQNYSSYYRKTKLMNHDWFDDITKHIQDMAFNGSEPDHQPFTFLPRTNAEGLPAVGDGSDEDPFVVGITTKRLLARLDRPPGTFVFHLDATYKLNQLDYPVVVCGISNKCRSFHLVAIFITSQQTWVQFVDVLSSLRDVYESVVSKPMTVQFIMGDAGDAQYIGCERVFGENSNFVYLM